MSLKFLTRFVLLLAFLASSPALRAEPAPAKAAYDDAMLRLKQANEQYTRWVALSAAAKESFNQGLDEDAKSFAEEIERLAPIYQKDWNYGNAVHDYNMVLGRLALKADDLQTARERLIAAGESRGSPQMNSFGPNMALARDLLARGDAAIVVEYFELCRKFWKLERGRLDQWKKDIEEKRVPDFGANLVF